MTSRNEQFVCFTAVLAIALPAVMWFRYVGPLRSSVAADERAIDQMRLTLGRYTEAELLPTSETDRVQSTLIRSTREEISEMMGRRPSVSEVYRGIEQAAARTRLSVARIEPGKDTDRSEFEGPLKEYAIEAESRSYRIELEGPASDLPVFLDAIRQSLDCVSVREVRGQYADASDRARTVTASVTLEALSLKPLKAEGSGK